MVSVVSVVARHAKAPISEYQAPTGVRNFQEMTLGFTSDIAKNNLGESLYRPWVPFVSTIFLFIFGSNWSGALVPWKLLELPEGELAAPTNNINTTVEWHRGLWILPASSGKAPAELRARVQEEEEVPCAQ